MTQIYNSLGFQSINTASTYLINNKMCTQSSILEEALSIRSYVSMTNWSKVLGYIPGVGFNIGIVRINHIVDYVDINNLENSIENLNVGGDGKFSLIGKIMGYVRAVFEIIGLGIIFLPFDLLASGYRFLVQDLHPALKLLS